MNEQRSRLSPNLFQTAFFVALLVPGMAFGSSPAMGQNPPSCPVPGTLTRGFEGPLAHVRYLADDALDGREVASQGARCASEYIAGHFADLGLEGAGPDGSFFQSFEVRMGSIPGTGNSLTLHGASLALGTDWSPYGFSSSGTAAAPLLYGGSGVNQPGAGEDAYARLDLTGKIVVLEGADPHGAGASVMTGSHFKATVAAGRDAAGVIILLPDGQSLPDPVTENRPDVKIPAVAVSGTWAETIREAAEAGEGAQLTTSLEPRLLEARNVVAKLTGADPALANEVLILGAHYDHLGHGGDGSLSPDAGSIHNGADDNASGTAALMEVARIVQDSGQRPARSILFLAFTGEEKGLWGSSHYVEEPLLPLARTVAMVNMDMVGRLRDNALTVYGTGTAQEWPDLLESLNEAQPKPFALTSIPDGLGASDHSEFYEADVPVLMLFTNTHAEYHRPEDDWDLINAEGLERVVSFAAGIVAEVAGSEDSEAMAVTLVEGAEGPQSRGRPADQRAGPGGGVYMGGIPDMTPQEFGVRITGTREGSPAEKAGLQEGDIIVEFGGKEISDLYAYTYALREHNPGDQVIVVVLRDGERVSLTAVLGRR